jgi:hypothetical protein
MWHAIYLVHTDFIYSYWIVNAVKLRLKDKFKQSCHTSIQNSPKTLFYRCIKEIFEFEKKYLEILDHEYLFDFFKFELATISFQLSVADGKT